MRSGFTPHPKISYVGASPTGVASEAEYVEIGLAREMDVDVLRTSLDAALPGEVDVGPAGETVFLVPQRLAVANHHEGGHRGACPVKQRILANAPQVTVTMGLLSTPQ